MGEKNSRRSCNIFMARGCFGHVEWIARADSWAKQPVSLRATAPDSVSTGEGDETVAALVGRCRTSRASAAGLWQERLSFSAPRARQGGNDERRPLGTRLAQTFKQRPSRSITKCINLHGESKDSESMTSLPSRSIASRKRHDYAENCRLQVGPVSLERIATSSVPERLSSA